MTITTTLSRRFVSKEVLQAPGNYVRPGLWMMGQLVDPARLVKDMEGTGIQFEVRSDGER